MSDERELRAALEKAQAALKKTRTELARAQDDQSKSEGQLEAARRQLSKAREREDALAADFEALKREKELNLKPPALRSRRSVSSDALARAAIFGLAVMLAGMGIRAFVAGAAGLGAALVGAAAVLSFNARRN